MTLFCFSQGSREITTALLIGPLLVYRELSFASERLSLLTQWFTTLQFWNLLCLAAKLVGS